ncbi:ABC transporter substrate binding protein [Roseateles sp. P5_D6]
MGTTSIVMGFAMLMSADSCQTPASPSIAYIGSWPEASDPVYKRFTAALSRRHPELSVKASIRHHQADAGNIVAIDKALKAALEGRPTVVVTPTGQSAMRAAKLPSPTPFVFSGYTDPVAAGIRDSLQFSASANTGVSLLDVVDGKRLEILKDAFPHIRRVAVLADRSWAEKNGGSARLTQPAHLLGLEVTVFLAESKVELDQQLAAPVATGYDAWYIPPSYIAYVAEPEIIDHLRRLKVPAMHSTAREVRAGALMAYEQDTSFVMDALADLVARVCDGERPGGIPVERPHRFTLILRANGDSGSPRPDAAVIRRADIVIR